MSACLSLMAVVKIILFRIFMVLLSFEMTEKRTKIDAIRHLVIVRDIGIFFLSHSLTELNGMIVLG